MSKSERKTRTGGSGPGSRSRSRPSGRGNSLLWAGLLILMTVLAYLPALQAGYIWDDDRYVTANPLLQSAGGLSRIWFKVGATVQYYPLVFSTFWIEHHLWGLRPFGFHLVNVLLHALSAVLLWRILRRLSLPGAYLAAAIFALHPIQVESVAWITERKNVLSGFFYLAAALSYLRFESIGDAGGSDGRRWSRYGLAFVFFACALFSKTVTSTLPAALFLLLWWKRDRLTLREVAPLVPMLIFGILMGRNTAVLERTNVGATGADWALSLGERFLIAGRAPWFYLGKILFPLNLNFIYPRWQLDAGAWWQILFPVALVVSLLALWVLRHRIGKGPLVAALFFCGTLFPALGFINTYPMRYSFVADHFQYLAGIGPVAGLVAALAWFTTARAGSRPAILALSGALLLGLGALTWHRGRVFRNLDTIYGDTLAKDPGCWMAHNNLGLILMDRGDLDRAQEHFQAALQEKPDFTEALNNQGRDLALRGRFEEAIPWYERALATKPKSATILANLGTATARLHRMDEARRYFDSALALAPGSLDTRSQLADALAVNGRREEAVAEYEAILRQDPRFEGAENNLANVLLELGRKDEAIACYERAIRNDPRSAAARANFGDALLSMGRATDAINQFTEAVRVQPAFARGHYRLAVALVSVGRIDEAIGEFRRVLALQPNDADTWCNVGMLLDRQGRRDEAIRAYQSALRINPAHARARQGLAAPARG